MFSTLQVYLGSQYVNDFNYLGRTYEVIAQADGPFRRTAQDISRLKARNAAGEMVPIGTVAQPARTARSPTACRATTCIPAAEVQGVAAPGVATGTALHRMEELAQQVLPKGIGFEWTDLAYQQQQKGTPTLLVFGAAALFVFLVLVAQYESWKLPLAIVLIVPMCLLASVTGLAFRGMPIDILAQIGFVVLVGLAAKNAILIVEFARQKEDEDGVAAGEAAVHAARTRLRPILMTSFAFILGVAPLAVATGAGAEMRQSLGHGRAVRHAGRHLLRPAVHARLLHASCASSAGRTPPERLPPASGRAGGDTPSRSRLTAPVRLPAPSSGGGRRRGPRGSSAATAPRPDASARRRRRRPPPRPPPACPRPGRSPSPPRRTEWRPPAGRTTSRSTTLPLVPAPTRSGQTNTRARSNTSRRSSTMPG